MVLFYYWLEVEVNSISTEALAMMFPIPWVPLSKTYGTDQLFPKQSAVSGFFYNRFQQGIGILTRKFWEGRGLPLGVDHFLLLQYK